MPMWRCPHCGTPQAETARCWVCHRSSTACATCQNFRRSVAAQLGYCGLDRARLPLRGDEIRGCWEASALPVEQPVAQPNRFDPAPADLDDDRTPVRRLEFVEVRSSAVATRRRSRVKATTGAVAGAGALPAAQAHEGASVATGTPVAVTPGEPRWSLWGDADS